MLPRLVGPGLAKVRRVRLVRTRTVSLSGLRDGAIAARLAAADVVSEGAMQGDSYFGSTDVEIAIDPDERADVAALLARDPHVRLRLLRLARREAAGRAEGGLLTLHAEVTVTIFERGVRMRVEVEAAVVRVRAVHA
jgi:hypothetical protein